MNTVEVLEKYHDADTKRWTKAMKDLVNKHTVPRDVYEVQRDKMTALNEEIEDLHQQVVEMQEQCNCYSRGLGPAIASMGITQDDEGNDE